MATKSDKSLRAGATNCGKSVAAFCRFLPLRFCPGFFLKPELRDSVFDKLPTDKGKTKARYLH
jgi:hypothetical protein